MDQTLPPSPNSGLLASLRAGIGVVAQLLIGAFVVIVASAIAMMTAFAGLMLAAAALLLRYAAVRPDAQGKGWGGRAIRAGIAEANRIGVDTCLETAEESNIAIYQRLGFAIVDEWQVPGGPRFWTMIRPKD